MSIQIDVSFGELLDKITILEIKFDHIGEPAKRANVERELAVLSEAWVNAGIDHQAVDAERQQLKQINQTLWDIEDEIRKLEAAKDFSEQFISLARRVYLTNDERSRIKRRINDTLGSGLIEEKSYQPY